MSNYKLHITPADTNKWIGHAILNEQIVFTTQVCDTPQECSQILSKYAASQTTQEQPAVPLQNDTSTVVQPAEAPRRCCGRG